MDRSPPGSSVHGILQARRLEWVVMPSSRGSSQPRPQNQCLLHLMHCIFSCWATPWGILVVVYSLSRVWLFATPWTVACQAPLSTAFSRQEHWSGVAIAFSTEIDWADVIRNLISQIRRLNFKYSVLVWVITRIQVKWHPCRLVPNSYLLSNCAVKYGAAWDTNVPFFFFFLVFNAFINPF